MKILIGSLLLLSLVGCEKNLESKSEECFFNDVKVSCDQMHGNQSNDSNLETKKNIIVEVEKNVSVNITESKITLLESALKSEVKYINGDRYECSLLLGEGAVLKYEVGPYYLDLILNQSKVVFERVITDQVENQNDNDEDGRKLILGHFKNINNDGSENEITIHSLNRLTLKATCRF